LAIADGQVIVSDAPGLGLDLEWERLTDHPYLPSHVLRLYEDGWETRGSSPLDPAHGAL
jgi:hypothetical protein